jgi:hypothetical protein
MVPLNISDVEGYNLAYILGYKIFHLPTTYLGVPLHHKTLTKKHWNFLLEKIEKKLKGWQGKLLSIGDRVTLLIL